MTADGRRHRALVAHQPAIRRLARHAGADNMRRGVGSQVDGVYVKYITVNGGPAVYYDAAGNVVHYNQGGTGARSPRLADYISFMAHPMAS